MYGVPKAPSVIAPLTTKYSDTASRKCNNNEVANEFPALLSKLQVTSRCSIAGQLPRNMMAYSSAGSMQSSSVVNVCSATGVASLPYELHSRSFDSLSSGSSGHVVTSSQ